MRAECKRHTRIDAAAATFAATRVAREVAEYNTSFTFSCSEQGSGQDETRASLQRTVCDQILNIDQMYTFCKENIKGITYFIVRKEEVLSHIEKLKERFDNCLRIKGTRTFHKFHAICENKVRFYKTSKTDVYEDHCISKIVPLSLEVNDTVACIYDGQWWLAQIEDISMEHNDVHVHFYHPAGPRTSFKKSTNDKVWIPISKVLRKISVLELTTATGRSHSISEKLSEEISMILNGHLA
ncbi:hypothetical protein ACJJTC_010519 [Scirpophaga incertulas]